MKFITPVLGEGLLQISEILPDDPVDFLVSNWINGILIFGRLNTCIERVLSSKASIQKNKIQPFES